MDPNVHPYRDDRITPEPDLWSCAHGTKNKRNNWNQTLSVLYLSRKEKVFTAEWIPLKKKCLWIASQNLIKVMAKVKLSAKTKKRFFSILHLAIRWTLRVLSIWHSSCVLHLLGYRELWQCPAFVLIQGVRGGISDLLSPMSPLIFIFENNLFLWITDHLCCCPPLPPPSPLWMVTCTDWNNSFLVAGNDGFYFTQTIKI